MRRSLFIVLAMAIAVSAHATSERDDVAIRGVVAQFFARYAGGDVAALMDLWSPSATGSKAFRGDHEAVLAVRCLTLEGVLVERIEQTGDAAVVDAQAAIAKSWRDGSRASSEIRNARLRLQREQGTWRVVAYEAREDELAARLVAAEDERERLRLLGEHPELVTRHLVWRLVRRGNSKINTSGPVAAAQPIADLALDLARQLGDRSGESMALGLSGVIARLTNDWPAATTLIKTSVAVALESGDPDAIARAYLNLSRIAQLEDRFGEAARAYPLRALEYSRQGEERLLRVRILEGVAATERIHENLFEARRYFDEVSRLAHELDDMSAQVTSGWNLAELYLEQGDLDMALYHSDRTVRLAREGNSFFIGFAVMQAGAVRMRRGDLAAARPLLQEALGILTERDDRDGLSLVHHLLATMHAAEGHFDEAECQTRELGKTYAAVGFRAEPALLDLAEMALAAGQYRRAAALGLEHAESRVDIEVSTAVKALRIAGIAFKKLGLLDRALPTLQEAVWLHDEVAETFVAGDEQQDVLAAEEMSGAFADIVDILVARGEIEEAFRYAEERKGRVLRKVLSAKLDPAEGMSAADRERDKELQRRIAELNRERDRVSGEEAADPARLAQLDRDLADARRAYRSFRDSVYVRHPRIQRRRGFVPVLPLRELRTRVPAGLAFVEFVVTDERTHAFVLRRDAFTVHSIDITREELERKIGSFATKLAARELAFRDDARTLFALLLAPLQDELRGVDAICIVPDGALWRLPFSALVDAKNRYVIERLSVSYAPSIAISMSVSGGDEVGHDTLLSLADPRLSPHIRADFASFYRASELGSLPHASREADALRKLYGEARSAIYTGSSATEALAKARAGEYRIVHFATHAILDDQNPMYSRLLLAEDRRVPEDDGYLEAWEIARLDLDADLVVLSACDTALGKIGGGEGVIGMTWALFVAGARATVASQWKVSSASTAELMIAFHRNLLAAAPASASRKADALRRAQLELIRDSRYAHPFYWSAFVLIGDAH